MIRNEKKMTDLFIKRMQYCLILKEHIHRSNICVSLNLISKMAVTAITANKDTAPTTAPTTRLLELSGVSAGEIRAEKCQSFTISIQRWTHPAKVLHAFTFVYTMNNSFKCSPSILFLLFEINTFSCLAIGWLIFTYLLNCLKNDALTLTSHYDTTSWHLLNITHTSGSLNPVQSFWVIISYRWQRY